MSDNTSGGLERQLTESTNQPVHRAYGFPITPPRGTPQPSVSELDLWRVSREPGSRTAQGTGEGAQREESHRPSTAIIATLNSAVDLCMMLVCVAVATMLADRPVGIKFPEFVLATFSAGAVWVAACAVARYYDARAFEREAWEDAALISVLVMIVALFLGGLNALLGASAAIPSVGWFLLLFWPGVLLLRLLVFRAIPESQRARLEVVIVGVGPHAHLTGEDLEKRGRYRVVGYLQFADEPNSAPFGARLLGTDDRLESVLRSTRVSKVFIAGDMVRQTKAIQAAIRVCETFGMPFALPASAFRFDRARPASRRAVADGYLHYLSGLLPHQEAVKRLLDIALSSIALLVLMPLFCVIAVLIKLTSRGPIFFEQTRAGFNGRTFHLMKFRTMIVNAEKLQEQVKKKNERSGPVFKLRNDPRVTKVGRLLRRYALDELPQLINVLRGEMSIVGPRPLWTSEVAFQEPWQLRRLAVRPGLTCTWQSRADRHQIPFEEWMRLDMQYIDHWSLAKDFALMFKTVPTLIAGAGDR